MSPLLERRKGKGSILMNDKEREQQLKDRIAKLPQVVRFYIEKLEHNLEYTRRQLEVVQGKTSRITWSSGWDKPDVYLPEDVTITIKVNGRELDFSPDENFTCVRVRASTGRVLVQPQVANAFDITVEK